MKNTLEIYKNSEFPINIEDIISSFWLTLEYFDFGTINGFIAWSSIVINNSLSLENKRFTIAHELWHFLDGEFWASTWLSSSTDPKEKIADRFAMDLLCPDYKVKELWEEYENIPTLAQFFQVSEELIEKKLKLLF